MQKTHAKSRHTDERDPIPEDILKQRHDDASAQDRSRNTSDMAIDMAIEMTEDIDSDRVTAEASGQDEARSATSPEMTIDEGIVARFLQTINWMPTWCRYDPHSPPEFTLSMNILLAFV